MNLFFKINSIDRKHKKMIKRKVELSINSDISMVWYRVFDAQKSRGGIEGKYLILGSFWGWICQLCVAIFSYACKLS